MFSLFPLSESAQFVATLKQGKDEFTTQTWSLKPSDVGLKDGVAYLSVSDSTCVPVGVAFMGISEDLGKFEFIWGIESYFGGICCGISIYEFISVLRSVIEREIRCLEIRIHQNGIQRK